jgi:peptidoglycan hydrolase CwlO-like protein
MKFVTDFLNELPPVVRHSIMLVVGGIMLGLTYAAMAGDIETAKNDAKDAKAATAPIQQDVKVLQKQVGELDMNQRVMSSQMTNIQQSVNRSEQRFERMEDKLDALLTLQRRNTANR